MKPLKTCLILLFHLFCGSIIGQNIKTHINGCFSLIPGIGILRYDSAKQFGIGLSVCKKLFDGTRSIEVFGIFSDRRYGPAYTDMHLDFMFGHKTNLYSVNPFLYVYYGSGTGRFIEYDRNNYRYYTDIVHYEKLSYGAGLNLLVRLGRKKHAANNIYFLSGFSAGYKTVTSRQNLYRYGNDHSTDGLAGRLHIGILLSVNN